MLDEQVARGRLARSSERQAERDGSGGFPRGRAAGDELRLGAAAMTRAAAADRARSLARPRGPRAIRCAARVLSVACPSSRSGSSLRPRACSSSRSQRPRAARADAEAERAAPPVRGAFCLRGRLRGFGIALPVVFLVGNHANASETGRRDPADRRREARPGALRRALRRLPHAGRRQRRRQGRARTSTCSSRRGAGAAHDQQRLPAEPAVGEKETCLGQGVMPAESSGRRRARTWRSSSPRSPGTE